MNRKGSLWLAVACFAFVSTLVNVAVGQATAAGPVRDQIYSALIGSWTGQLEYRDFQTDRQTMLPAWLEVKPSEDGRSLQFSYIYDDGPSKTVTEVSTVAIEPAAHRFSITSDRDRSSESYQIGALDGLNAAGHAQFTITGVGQENHKPVDVRITVTIDRNLYQFRKETTRTGDADFRFRDGYVFTRRAPAK